MGRADDRLVLVDVGDDLGHLTVVVAHAAQGTGHGLVDDRHRASADQLLRLAQPEVGLDAGGVAVHQETNGARRRQDRGLRVAHPCDIGQVDGFVPRLLGRRQQLGRHLLLVDRGDLLAVLSQHTVHRLAVLGIAREGAHAGGRAGRGHVGATGHERGDSARPGAPLVGVVGQAEGHQQRAEVGVAQPELAEAA